MKLEDALSSFGLSHLAPLMEEEGGLTETRIPLSCVLMQLETNKQQSRHGRTHIYTRTRAEMDVESFIMLEVWYLGWLGLGLRLGLGLGFGCACVDVHV